MKGPYRIGSSCNEYGAVSDDWRRVLAECPPLPDERSCDCIQAEYIRLRILVVPIRCAVDHAIGHYRRVVAYSDWLVLPHHHPGGSVKGVHVTGFEIKLAIG